MYKIAIIEDDKELSEMVGKLLSKYGYEVAISENFKEVEHFIEEQNPHLILLDINLPYYDGFYIARKIREKSDVPIIIISARSSEGEQVRGLEIGADDYVVKPFGMEVLQAKIAACLRRTYGGKAEVDVVKNNGLSVDKKTFLMAYSGQKMELTKNELKIMTVLLENIDQIVTRETLLNLLWDDVAFVEDNTLTVNMTRIKGKLEGLGLPDAIKTKRKEGYMLHL